MSPPRSRRDASHYLRFRGDAIKKLKGRLVTGFGLEFDLGSVDLGPLGIHRGRVHALRRGPSAGISYWTVLDAGDGGSVGPNGRMGQKLFEALRQVPGLRTGD